MLTSVANVTLRILLFRSGPQDLPYEPTLSRLLIPLALLGNFALAWVTLPAGLAAISALMGVLGTAVATRTLLRLRRLENRYTQTFHSLLLVGTLITLACILPLSQLMPEMLKLVQNPQVLEQHPEAIDLPEGPVMLFALLLVWNFAVTAHIYREAAGLRMFGGIAVALLVSVSLQLFVSFSTSIIGTVLGLMPPGVS